MDLVKEYIEKNFKGHEKDLITAIVDSAILAGTDLDDLVSRIDKFLLRAYASKK
jgi:hypothetical protein